MSNKDSYTGSRRDGDRYLSSDRHILRDRYPRQRDPRDLGPGEREHLRERDTRGVDPRMSRYNDYREPNFRERRYGNGNQYNRGRPYEKYNPRRDNNRHRGDHRREKQDNHFNPDASLTKEEKVAKYEKILIEHLKYPTLSTFPIKDSQWGIRPKGFEDVTAQRAKLSGLFPLPGSQAAEPAKLDAIEKGSAKSDVLLSTSKIDPIDSRHSRTVIVTNIDFLKVDYLKLADYINKLLCSADLEGTFLDDNIELKKKAKDGKSLIIQFKSSQCATFALTMNGKDIPIEQISQNETSETVVLSLERPGEYVVQCLPPYSLEATDIDDEVIDSPRKVTLFVDPLVTETMLLDNLQKIAKVKAFKLVRAVGTKESLGVAFVEFYISSKECTNTKSALKLIGTYVEEAKKLDIVSKIEFSCIKIGENYTSLTSIQDCPIDFKTLKSLVRNEYVQFHPKLKVIQLINIVTIEDLCNDETYKFIYLDIFEEAKTFGTVLSLKIPKPSYKKSPGVEEVIEPGVGKVFVEYEDEKTALSAIMGLAGRSYNDRTVLCAFFNHEDYIRGLF